MSEPGPEISVVVPAFNEEGNVAPLCTALTPVLDGLTDRWEVILCDDGSTDGTWAAIRALAAGDPRIRGVRLSRNFGHQYALVAAMERARGAAVISMDADLQHPPAVVPELVARWRDGAKVVKTIREGVHYASWFKRASSRAFYRVFSKLSGVDIQPGMADFRLLDRVVVEALHEFEEEGLFLRGIVEWVGYPSATVRFESAPRASGASKYTYWKMLRFAWHGVSSFSVVPLRMGIALGLVSSVIAFLSVIYAIVAKWGLGETVPGWTSTVAITSFLFGVLFVYLGVLGEYLGRILVESRRRPRFLISDTAGIDDGA
ncbi:MAG: glycosyltransferase family 2 protein [Planctomycetota bacterium]|jgi:dolichol-phosphate mannosyltransferase